MRIAVDAHRIAHFPRSSHCRYLLGMLPHWQNDPRISEVILALPRSAEKLAFPQELDGLSKIRKEFGESARNPTMGLGNLFYFHQVDIPAILKRTKPDVFLSTFHLCPFFTGGVPVVTTIHDLCPLDYQIDSLGWLKWRETHRFQLWTACLKSRLLIAVSKFTASALKTYCPRKADSIRMVHNGFDCPESKPSPLPHENYLLWVGELGYRKNPELALDTLAALLPQNPQLRLRCVIPARDRTEAEAMMKQRNLCGHIDWESNIPEQRLDELYRQACALIVPSRCEGFGYPILEGISRGIPSLGYRRTPAIEITGNTLDLPSELSPSAFAASIQKVLNLTQDERASLSRSLIERAGTFTTHRMATQTADVLLEACQTKSQALSHPSITPHT